MTTADPFIPSEKMLKNNEDFLDYAQQRGFGDLHFKICPQTGMKAIIAIHSTNLGPALGGCRFIHYPDSFSALYDAMRLARGMSYKSALVNLPLGGGKAVVLKPSNSYDRQAYFKSFGKFVNDMNGRYITALDSGTELSDMDIIAEHTPYVASLSSHHGDPAPYTALGVLRGIEAAVLFKLKKDTLKNIHVAIQGLGHVGYLLAKYLHELGARLTVADIDPLRVEKAINDFNASAVSSEDIHKVPCDVFSPCALGAIVNDITIHQFQTPVIAGAANNQLAHAYHGQQLHEKSILYATDYVINAGGLIFAASKYFHSQEHLINKQIDGIGSTLLQIFERSAKENLPVSEITDTLAQEKLAHPTL